MATKVLVVDDDVELIRALAELLSQGGFAATTAQSAEEALECCRQESFHVALTDLQMPGRNGISLIKTLHQACPETKTVLITGHGSVRTAVTALKRGAVEYLAKPIKPRRLLALLHALTADPPAYLTNRLLATQCMEAAVLDGMTARSRVMQETFERIRLAAEGDSTVLILGECGSGKEMAARAIHHHSSNVAAPFVVRPANSLARHLGDPLGVLATAAPGEAPLSDGGTLFLDELSSIDPDAQLGLLRLLEALERSSLSDDQPAHRVRVVAAASQDLEALVAAGQFREDLYYRLNIVTVKIPALRERGEDIPLLAAEFLNEFSARYTKSVVSIPAETQRLLSGYIWPGNVRELRNVIEQAVLLARGTELDPQLLPQMLHRGPMRREMIKIPIGTAMEQVEREVILRTLEANDGNKTATAEVLGISRRSIYNKLAVYGIDAATYTG